MQIIFIYTKIIYIMQIIFIYTKIIYIMEIIFIYTKIIFIMEIIFIYTKIMYIMQIIFIYTKIMEIIFIYTKIISTLLHFYFLSVLHSYTSTFYQFYPLYPTNHLLQSRHRLRQESCPNQEYLVLLSLNCMSPELYLQPNS
jgi:hypothetical protein